MSNRVVKIGKLKIKNPIILASGTFDRGITKKIDIKRLGAIVTKTITLKPREGNPLPHIYKSKYGWLNSVGFKNVGLEKYLSDELPFWQKYQTTVITSLTGKTEKDYITIIKALKNIKNIEIDGSCPNVDGFGLDSERLGKIIKKTKKIFAGTVLVKLPPDIFNIVPLAKIALKAGADILTIANTYPSLEFVKSRPIFSRITAGYSGGAIKPITMAMVWKVHQKFKCPIIASGGIENTQDVLDYLAAGAKAVQIGSANFLNPHLSVKIIDELEGNK